MNDITNEINILEKEIFDLKQRLREKEQQLDILIHNIPNTASLSKKSINLKSDPLEKIKLFRNLFRGREDVYALRFESVKSGKPGYQPVCINEYIIIPGQIHQNPTALYPDSYCPTQL